MKNRNQHQDQEVQRPGDLDGQHPADRLDPGRQRRGHPQPGDQRQRGGHEHRDEVREQLQAVVGGPAALGRPVQRQVLDQHRDRAGEHVPGGGHDPLPLPGGEQQHVEDRPVEQPQHVGAQVPPAGQPDGMPQPGQADLAGQADRVLLGRPQRVRRDRFLEPEPVPARGAVPGPVQPGVIGQDLQPGPDDEDHEQRVEEVLRVHPPRQPRMGPRGGQRPRVPGHEPLHRRHVPQPLRDRHRGDQHPPADRQQPQQVEPPVPAHPHPRRDARAAGRDPAQVSGSTTSSPRDRRCR